MSNALTVYDKNVLHNEAIKTAKMTLKAFTFPTVKQWPTC